MTRNRRLRKIENKEIADRLLSENYTLDDVLDTQAQWQMINLNEEKKKEFLQQKQMEVFVKNLAPCIAVSEKNLNGLSTFQNAENKGLTKDMTDEQKCMLKDLSDDVNFRRILAVTRRGATVLFMLTAITNLFFSIYNKEIYAKIHPAEDYFFWGLFATIIGLFVVDIKTNNNIMKRLYFLAKSREYSD